MSRKKIASGALAILGAMTLTTALSALDPPPTSEDFDAARRFAEASRIPTSGAGVVPEGPTIDAGRGPVSVHVPPSYDPGTPMPLIILLHGYTNTGPEIEAWFQLTPLANEFGFFLIYPTGTSSLFGPFWNATDACCNLFGSSVDDSGYLRALVEEMASQYNVDPRRIHFAGHSNGGFMSYRMACDHADLVASIASLAGATYQNPNDCAPSGPVHTLQIHGTSDGVIDYNGGCIPLGGCYPSAVQTAQTWASYNGCSPTPDTSAPSIDLDGDIPGAESNVTKYESACNAGGSSQLWTIPGGPHSPNLSPDFSRLVVEFLFAHPKPALCPADLDGSGSVDFADILAVIAAWGPCASCPADLDGSGDVGFGDIFALIAAWGEC